MFVVRLDACCVVRKGYGQTVAADGHGVKRDVYGEHTGVEGYGVVHITAHLCSFRRRQHGAVRKRIRHIQSAIIDEFGGCRILRICSRRHKYNGQYSKYRILDRPRKMPYLFHTLHFYELNYKDY